MGASALPEAAVVAVVAEVKALLRIAGSGDDTNVRRAARSALTLGERFLGLALIARGHEEVLGAGVGWQRLAASPVSAIGGVTGLPADGAGFVLAVGDYALDIDAAGDGWVRVLRPGAAGRVRVAYSAGLSADWAGLAEPVREGVVRLAAHLVEARDEGAMPPAAVAALWRPYRRMRLAAPKFHGEHAA